MKSKLFVLTLAAALLLVSAADPAWAGRRSFSIDPMGVRTGNGAGRDIGTGGLMGISLPDGAGGPEFGFGFVIPKPYKRNSPIRIIMSWQTQSTGCGINFQPEFLDRSRPGHASTAAFGPTDGLAPEDGLVLLNAPATAVQGGTKVFTVSPGQGFDQLSGDAILVAFFRDDGAPNDTCVDDLIVSGILVEYLTP